MTLIARRGLAACILALILTTAAPSAASAEWSSASEAASFWRLAGEKQMAQRGITRSQLRRMQRRVRRAVLRSDAYRARASRHSIIVSPRSQSFGYTLQPIARTASFLGDLKKMGKAALKAAKKVANNALKIVPQTRVARCALFGVIGAYGSLRSGGPVDVTLIDAAIGCIGVSLPPLRGKGPTGPEDV